MSQSFSLGLHRRRNAGVPASAWWWYWGST